MEPFASALETASAIRRREVSPLEVLEACLARVDRLNPQLNAIIWRNDAEAREDAKRATDLVAKTDPVELPAFHGVPLPIKDLTPVAGWPTSFGSAAAKAEPSAQSDMVVDAFRRAGFVLTGASNTPEFGSITATENRRYGITRNPWDADRSPGGSSGGAGAAVASGMFPAAHGNDGGGSIRIPASCNGLVGLKVSRGRVPALVESWEGAAVEGVLTRSIADTAAILDQVVGPDPLAWYNAPALTRPLAQEVGAPTGKLRIAMADSTSLGLPVAPECIEAVHAAGRLLEQLGHTVEPAKIDLTPEELVIHFVNIVSVGLAGYDGLVDFEKVEPHNRNSYLQATTNVTGYSYLTSIRALQSVSRGIVAAWGRDFDVLLTPTMACEPYRAGHLIDLIQNNPEAYVGEVLPSVIFTAPFNVSGQPALNLPLHWSRGENPIPIGVQLVASPWDEAALIRLGAQVEAAAGWTDRTPPIS